MSFKTRLEKIKEDEKLAGILPDSQAAAQIEKNISTKVENQIPETMADEILMRARNAIIESGMFYISPEVRAAEADINQAFKAILNGGEDYAALREACERWKLAATSKPGS